MMRVGISRINFRIFPADNFFEVEEKNVFENTEIFSGQQDGYRFQILDNQQESFLAILSFRR